MPNDPLHHLHRVLGRQFAIGQVGRSDGQRRGQLPSSLGVRTVTHDAVLLENLAPVEQRVQQSMGVGRIYDHAKAGDGEKCAETKKRGQA
jgi:hypothetical protein